MVVPLLLLAACASEREIAQEMEQMLAAAGFRMQPADTPQRQTELAALPPRQLLAQRLQAGGKDAVGYVYGDPDFCHCVYLGDAKAFQAYQQLAFQQRLAQERLQAAAMEESASFNWGAWGPGFWGPEQVIVIHGGGRR